MRALSLCLIALLVGLLPKEGYVSVIIDPQSLADMARLSPHIVKAQPLGTQEITYRVVFPKETSHNGTETVYSQWVEPYRVLSVVRSPTLKIGDIIHIRHEGIMYEESVVRAYHETGSRPIPIVEAYQPRYPVTGQQSRILMLRDYQIDKARYVLVAEDGVEIEQELRALPPARIDAIPLGQSAPQ